MDTTKLKRPASAFMLFLMIFMIGSSLVIELTILEVLIPAGVVTRAIFGSMWYLIFMQLVRFILPLFIWLAVTKDSFKRRMPHQPMGPLNYLYVFFISILAIPAMMLVSGISSLFVNNDAADFMAGASGAGHSWLLMMLAIAVTPGIVEELAFRGYIQSASRGSLWKVAVFNGFLFGLMHMNLHQFMYTFLLGIFFAYMVYYTRSVWSAIFSHFLVNGVNITLVFWATGTGEYAEAAADLTFSQAMYDSLVDTSPELAQQMYDLLYGVDILWFAIGMIGVIATFATIGVAALFYVFVQHNKKRNAAFDEASSAATMPLDTSEADTGKTARPAGILSKIDWCLVGVVAIYIAFTVVLPRVL
jgi:membrane protease YdiL (CAAX protease family)